RGSAPATESGTCLAGRTAAWAKLRGRFGYGAGVRGDRNRRSRDDERRPALRALRFPTRKLVFDLEALAASRAVDGEHAGPRVRTAARPPAWPPPWQTVTAATA